MTHPRAISPKCLQFQNQPSLAKLTPNSKTGILSCPITQPHFIPLWSLLVHPKAVTALQMSKENLKTQEQTRQQGQIKPSSGLGRGGGVCGFGGGLLGGALQELQPVHHLHVVDLVPHLHVLRREKVLSPAVARTTSLFRRPGLWWVPHLAHWGPLGSRVAELYAVEPWQA